MVLHIIILMILGVFMTFFITSILKKIAEFIRRRKMYLIKQSFIKVSFPNPRIYFEAQNIEINLSETLRSKVKCQKRYQIG